jgi:hypothetical protein
MNTQLIKIKTIPIQYEIHMENARLTTPEIDPGEFEIETTPLKIETETTPVQMRMDSSDMRRSMGMKTIADVMREAPGKTQEAANKATSRYVSRGNRMANGQADGITVVDIAKQDFLSKYATTIESTIGSIPTEKVDISWEPATVKHDVQKSEAHTDWKKAAQEMEFVPSNYSLEIQRLAEVEIEYIGGFQYVPPSSDPEFEGDK